MILLILQTYHYLRRNNVWDADDNCEEFHPWERSNEEHRHRHHWHVRATLSYVRSSLTENCTLATLYCAMLYRARYCYANVVSPSVRPKRWGAVRWVTSKPITWIISLSYSLFAAPKLFDNSFADNCSRLPIRPRAVLPIGLKASLSHSFTGT